MLGKGAAPGREIERAKESEPKANFKRDGDVSQKVELMQYLSVLSTSKNRQKPLTPSDLIDCRDEEGQRQNN